MLKKKLGAEAIEMNWGNSITEFYKVPTSLIIPPECWRVGNWAFEGCYNLKEVVVSDSVVIGFGAFENCYNATIILRKSKKDFAKIGQFAFKGCKNVKEEIRS